MQFASLGSGSKGNGTVVRSGASAVLVDCGFSIKETEKRLDRLSLQVSDLTGILVTHEHGDHLKGVLPLARKYRLPVYMTAGTARKCSDIPDIQLNLIRDGLDFPLGNMSITPVAVPHDAREPVQFVFSNTGGSRLGILTDLGSVTQHVIDCFFNCDGLFVEANHDSQMLQNGSYPISLKRRVAGPWGHLNNLQTAQLLGSICLDRLQQLVVGHISQQNNCLGQVQTALAGIEHKLPEVVYACQDQGFGWIEITA